MRLRQSIGLLLIVILISAMYTGHVLASDTVLRTMEAEFIEVVDDVGPAIVEITAIKRNTGGHMQIRMVSENIGTGVIFDKKGYIVTTESVIGNADKVTVTLTDGRIFPAEIVGSDSETDIALIRIDARDLPTASLGSSDDIRSGSWVITMGRSYGSSPTLSFGVVGGIEPLPGGGNYYDAIKINAAISPGNSGGGVVGMDGKIVGIITAALAEPKTLTFEYSGKSPFIDFRAELNRAKSAEKLAKARLFTARQELDVMKSRQEAALVTLVEVEKAQTKYIQAQTEYENVLTDIESLMSQIEISAPHKREIEAVEKEIDLIREQLDQGDINNVRRRKKHLDNIDILLKKLRGDKARTMIQQPVARFFGQQEEGFAIPITFAKHIIDDLMDDGRVERGWLGVYIRPVSYPDMEALGLDSMEGAIIVRLTPNSPADNAGIQKDDAIISFDGKKIRQKNSLVRMVAATKPNAEVNIAIVRNKQEKILKAKIGKMTRE